MTAPRLSAIIITRNEAHQIAECIASVSFCDEIIVVDGNSTDSTVEIASSLGCRVIQTADWPGFGKQKQRALEAATGQWVLSIDADERVTDDLRSEILLGIASNSLNGFYLNRKSQFLGRWMNHGGWDPDWTLRLVRRQSAAFDLSPVHERLLVQGSTEKLKGPLLHYSYRSIADILTKQKTYALAGSEKRKGNGHSSTLLIALTRSLWAFFRHYIFQLGFLDRRQGLVAAIAKSQETFWKHLAAAWPGDRSKLE